MKTLIFDIETIGENFEKMDKTTQEIVTRWIRKESESEEEYKILLEELKEGLGFSPLTGQIVAVGILDYEEQKGAVYYQAPEQEIEDFEAANIKFRKMSEKEIVEKFWEIAVHYDQFVTFNGRGFDVPFLMVRSAVWKVKPTKNLMSNRYLDNQKPGMKHIDLQDQLSFYGSVRRKGNLHLWSRVFSIDSPKSKGITGDMIGEYYRTGKYKEIARYNAGDLFATSQLYTIWREYFCI